MTRKKSRYEVPITIADVVDNIHQRKYLLPAIQREFVWNHEQIIRLFDSILRGYPIGSFLFWDIEKERIKDYHFYEFIDRYHEKDNKHNKRARVDKNDNVTVILDGQQRLTALYIALRGTYAYKLKNKRRDNPTSYPTRKLYLNLLSPAEENNAGNYYDLDFLCPEDVKNYNENGDNHWFNIGDVLGYKGGVDINKYLGKHMSSYDDNAYELAYSTLDRALEGICKDTTINYYLENSQDIDKVLDIFIRVNSGGTPLTHSDLLLSIATAKWDIKDARDEIINFVDEINQNKGSFSFNNDFVLKNCLVLSDLSNIAFQVKNFNKKNMKKIENKWDDIKEAIRISIELVASYGYDGDTLTSTNAIIPIAYYIMKTELPNNFVEAGKYDKDRKKIKKWLTLSLVKRTFSGHSDTLLQSIRKIIKKNHEEGFPFQDIVAHFKGGEKEIIFNNDNIENLLAAQYGKPHTFSILTLLYPSLDFRNLFNEDHIYAQSLFKKKELNKNGITPDDQEFYLNNFNSIVNLQLLEVTFPLI